MYGEFKGNANHPDKGSDFSPLLFFWLVFIPTTLNHYSLVPIIQIMLTFCHSTFPFSVSLNTRQSPKRSGRVYESLFLTQFFSVLCNLWNSASGEKSQSHFPSSRIGKSQFSEPSVIKQLLLKCSSYKFCFSFCCCCCCFFISGFVRSADSEEKPVKQFRSGGFQPSLWYTLNG